jgi:hypothetical protein
MHPQSVFQSFTLLPCPPCNVCHVFLNRLKTAKERFSNAAKTEIINLTDDEVSKFAFGATRDEVQDLTHDSTVESVDLTRDSDADMSLKDTGSVKGVAYPRLPNDSCSLFRTWVGQQAGIERIGYRGLSQRDLDTLRPNVWVTDEIINMYMHLLAGSRPGTYFFSSFTYAKLLEELYAEEPNWAKFLRYAKRINFCDYDYVLFPIHQPGHWCLVVAYPKQLKLAYFDSMGGTDGLCLKLCESFFQARGEANSAEARFKSDWTLEFVGPRSKEPIPEQEDGVSCGLFVCALADVLTAGGSRDQWGYSQQDMAYFRKLVRSLMTKFRA